MSTYMNIFTGSVDTDENWLCDMKKAIKDANDFCEYEDDTHEDYSFMKKLAKCSDSEDDLQKAFDLHVHHGVLVAV